MSLSIGLAIFPTDQTIAIDELAREAEARGFESLWVTEHTHIPAERRTPWPGGGELPGYYARSLDPFVALTAAAAATSRLRVATGVCLVVEHDPIILAKQVASLDLVSGGRVLFGVGGGWNREEMENHGTAFGTRWKLLRERVEAMKAIWTQDEAEYHGELVDFDPIRSWPKPVQRPHPPVLVGGSGPRILERVVRYGDGWMPNRGDALSRIPELRRLAEAAGRDPIPVTAYPAATPEALAELEQAGVERALFYVSQDGREAALRRVEELTRLCRPHLR